ncbi:MAG: tetratricopeptide repeat protein [Hyphomicrobiaceae bacterium]|nr:tetratricopeptide repeat protein [Hyphomicrobiaceae bacterium]
MSDDSLFREVDEAVRQDQLKALWDKYGLWMVVGAVLIVAVVGGHNAWTYWQSEQSKAAGGRFIGGITEVEDGKTGDAINVFKSLSEEGPGGYKDLSQLQLAALYSSEGKNAEAVKIYDRIAESSAAGSVLQQFARIQAASLVVDESSFEAMRKRLDDLAVTGNPWRHSARELLGLSAYRNGESDAAQRYFDVMLSDQQTPANMRRRAEMMLSLLVQLGGGTGSDKK